MRILVIGDPSIKENMRLSEEARRSDTSITILPMREVSFDIDGMIRVKVGRSEDLLDYDVLYLRSFYPHISEGLMLAEYASGNGLRVIDRNLATGNFVQSKMYDAWKLAEGGLPVPRSRQSLHDQKEETAKTRPVVMKGVHGSKGRYVFRADEKLRAERLEEEYGAGFFVAQEFLEIEAEYRVVTVGYRSLGVMEKLVAPGEFRHNISVGSEGKRADLPDDYLRLCEDAARVLGHEFAGVDLAIAKGKPHIIEVNRSPGFTAFEKATGQNVARSFLEYATRPE